MEIKLATSECRELWCQLRYELWPYYSKEELDHGVSDILDSETEWGFIGYQGAEPVGFIELRIRDRAPGSEDQKVPYLEAWYVREPYRENGYGRRFVEFFEDWARQRGFSRLASDTTSEFPGSLQAHRAIGFKEVKTVHHFIKNIDA